MAKVKQYQFEVQPITVVTPLAETLFMCLNEVNETTGVYGGILLLDEAQLDTKVNYKVGKTGKEVGTFGDVVNNLIDDALEEYNSTAKKPAVRADKFKPHLDKDGEETDKIEFSVKNMEQPRIIAKDKTVIKDFDQLVGNGSTVKVSIYLKPYVMQGKVGVTAYMNSVLIDNLIEYSGGGDMDLFDDDDFEDTTVDDFDDVEEDF